MVIKSDIIYLEVCGITVDAHEVHNREQMMECIKAFKEAYKLTPNSNYVFFLKRESKMNIKKINKAVTVRKIRKPYTYVERNRAAK